MAPPEVRPTRPRRAWAWLAKRRWSIAFFAALFVLLCALRMPLADRPIRDVDEAVSSIIASEWLHGGVPYRDAIDQRGPVTYGLYALTFLVAGHHNMFAVHWLLLLLIFGGCILLYRFGGELAGALLRPDGAPEVSPDLATGYLAALLTAIVTFTYRRSQMLAFHTEWPVLILSSLGMLLLWRTLRRDDSGDRAPLWPLAVAGVAFGAAFLSKQPAVFDGFAAGAYLLAWQARQRCFVSRETLARAGALAGGFFAALGLTAGYFAAQGALGDAYLYFWQYNVEHYTAVVSTADKIRALNPWDHSRHYLRANPLLMVFAAVALLRALVDWILRGWRSIDGRTMLALWFAGAYFGASYSGRNFGHYFIQLIAPACLIAALAVRELWQLAGALRSRGPEASRRWGSSVARAVLVVALVASLGYSLHRYRRDMTLLTYDQPPRPKVAQDALVAYVSEHTGPADRIFVWGYNPEIYVLADRRPATRYSNTNYLTGMLPWENHRHGVDTSEHIVPGGWEILFQELAAHPPALLIDTSTGDHRFYGKYSQAQFPRLRRYVAEHYALETTIRDHKKRPYYDVYRRR